MKLQREKRPWLRLVRVGICLLCKDSADQPFAMREIQLIDHIEQIHKSPAKTMEEYREWIRKNFIVEERASYPEEQRWIRDIKSRGIQTGVGT